MKLAAENAMFYRRNCSRKNCKRLLFARKLFPRFFILKSFISIRENLKVVFMTVLLAL